jgi:uncharacterized membrane protein YphA (DoxX/SURF4 family)
MIRSIATLFRPSIGDAFADAANLLLRVVAGGMIFWIHGVHKAEGAVGYFSHGTSWTLLEEVRGMGVPFPEANAVFATFVQLFAPPFIIVGFCTRPAAILLFVILLGAVMQNLLSGRDPQLAVLYTLATITIGIWGAGRYSFDARRFRIPQFDKTQKEE